MVVVEVALSIVNDPGTYAIWKLPGVVPFTIAAIAVVPAFGPTLAGLFVHAKSPVYAPLTTQAEGEDRAVLFRALLILIHTIATGWRTA